MMYITRRAAVDIERDTELGKRVFDYLVITVDNLLNGDAFLACTDSNRYAMLVAAADEDNFLFLQTEIANVNISWHIHSSKMTDVYTAIGIR